MPASSRSPVTNRQIVVGRDLKGGPALLVVGDGGPRRRRDRFRRLRSQTLRQRRRQDVAGVEVAIHGDIVGSADGVERNIGAHARVDRILGLAQFAFARRVFDRMPQPRQSSCR